MIKADDMVDLLKVKAPILKTARGPCQGTRPSVSRVGRNLFSTHSEWMLKALRLFGLLIVTCGFTHAPAKPGKFAYPPQRFSLHGVRAIQIVGVKGTLKLHGRKSK